MNIPWNEYFLKQSLILLLFISFQVDGQETNKKLRLGFNYGIGSQTVFPFKNSDYTYDNQFFKIQLNYLLKEKAKWQLEINVEPSLYLAEHQLLNMYYVQPNRGPDYLDQRERFTKLYSFNEYVLNIGLITRYNILSDLSAYLSGSVGPMYGDAETERLARGFAFSDIIAIGTSYQIKKILLDLRFSIRHTSNADLYYPNAGHNSSNIEVGFLFEL